MRRLMQLLLFISALQLLLVAYSSQSPSVTATLTSTVIPTPVPAIDAEAVTWLKANGIPFKTTKPGGGFDNLEPLKKIIGDARIVGLGQASHGTHESQEFNAQLIEFLVEEMGFNIWAMEVPMAEAFPVDDYVQTGRGDPASLLSGLHFWIWNTQEVLDTFKWVRAHNAKPGATQVSFYGFDVPYSLTSMHNVLDYLKKVDPAAEEKAASLYRCFQRDVPRQDSDSEVLPFTKACTDNLQKVYDDLLAKQSAYERLSSPKEFAVALQNARLVLLIDAAYAPGSDESDRDRAMAENVNWILNQAGPNAKIIVTAHNFHIMSTKPPMVRSVGTILKGQYGKEMVALGTSFYGGFVNEVLLPDPKPNAHPIPVPPPDSYEALFHVVGLPQFFVDLRNLEPGSSAANWMAGPHPFRWIPNTAFSTVDLPYSATLPSEFDVMVHFEETSPSILLTE